MSLLRAFIAIEIPPEIHSAIQKRTAALRSTLDASLVRWVPAGNVHLTLKFLGEVSPPNVELLARALEAEAAGGTPFELRLEGLGCFPSARRPRVVWIGVQAPAELERLQRGVEAAAARLGYPPEPRAFSPHLTIGRVRDHLSGGDLQAVRTALEGATVEALGTARIDALTLFKSDLRPAGAVYTRLCRAPLGPQGRAQAT